MEQNVSERDLVELEYP